MLTLEQFLQEKSDRIEHHLKVIRGCKDVCQKLGYPYYFPNQNHSPSEIKILGA